MQKIQAIPAFIATLATALSFAFVAVAMPVGPLLTIVA